MKTGAVAAPDLPQVCTLTDINLAEMGAPKADQMASDAVRWCAGNLPRCASTLIEAGQDHIMPSLWNRDHLLRRRDRRGHGTGRADQRGNSGDCGDGPSRMARKTAVSMKTILNCLDENNANYLNPVLAQRT